MMKLILVLIAIVCMLGCGGHAAPQATPSAPGDPHLILSANPRQGFSPLRVTFRVVLEGAAENNADWHCMKEEWDYGDGSISSQKPNCEPFTAESKITTEFFSDHVYEIPGGYTASFTLGEKKLRSNKVGVRVLESVRTPRK